MPCHLLPCALGLVALQPVSVWAAGAIAFSPVSLIAMVSSVLVLTLLVVWMWRRERWRRKALEQQLGQPGGYDAATGLPGRNLFDDRFAHAIARHGRNQTHLGLMVIQVDNYHPLCRRLGAQTINQQLRELVSHWRQCIRRSDTLARTGPDQFTVLLDPVMDSRGAGMVAKALVSATNRHNATRGEGEPVCINIGVALYPQHGAEGISLLKRAHEVVQRSGRRGTSGYKVA
ncbi:GGDEF domain-containing protein [Ferrimonas marina]|uniref:Diguanylate cyclase (GGDEF) domain-containing protein n=1 Tax=Ferrimonas marina TaxID=299255 RepID=A0A1M5N1V0_9GAMM|nr:GGDEF domain-containing protein [Ferrimonas marina]SHG82983.1 diguanylate cyclase (GGDEF) domain-containing protein [Ferrimonas marina]